VEVGSLNSLEGRQKQYQMNKPKNNKRNILFFLLRLENLFFINENTIMKIKNPPS
jgi:hypothetical protein